MLSPADGPATSRSVAPGNLRQAKERSLPVAVPPADLSPANAATISSVISPGDLGPTSGPTTSLPSSSADLSPANVPATSAASPRGDFGRGHTTSAAQRGHAPVDLGTDHAPSDSQNPGVGAESSPGQSGRDAQAVPAGAPSNGQVLRDTQTTAAVGSDGNGHMDYDARGGYADPSDALLLILADALDDLERQRIASENRLRSLAQVKGLQGSQAEFKLGVLTEALAGLEHQATLELQRAVRTHPLGPWVKQTIGIGEKQGARLIAAIGDPYMRPTMFDRETGEVLEEARPRRGPAELWAYCGFVPGQKRRKGVKSNWNAQAKMRAFLCAESCMKQRSSPFREVYDRERAKWADRDVSDGHKHAHALRVVAKEILKDLWRFAAKLEPAPVHRAPDATGQLRTAGLAATPSPTPPSEPLESA